MSHHDTTISRLTIGGFKSFADEVRLDILPGLTGIIGPNGCGKSNVVEGLRWAMGETSARALRGGELDDLIFAGTGARSARNIAQVTLSLTGAAGLAPAPFQNADELEISRRAERGSGSEYRINGRVMRARDVQTLFADLASGARSSAIVSQNRVGQLIAAKPEERRLLLEEAAGITGLHARRHDAELKLRQTETNLSRAEDLRLQIEERLESLEGQTVQARKYREISEKLRDTETQLHALLHARANLAIQRSRDDLAKAREALKKAEYDAEQATIAEFEVRKTAPYAREETDRLRTVLERLKLRSETARAEMDRAGQAEREALERLQQAQADLAQTTEQCEEIAAAIETGRTDLAALDAENAALPARRQNAEADGARLSKQEHDEAAALETAIRLRDAEIIRRDGLMSALDALTTRLSTETGALQAVQDELATLERDRPDDAALQTLRDQTTLALEQAEVARQNAAASATALQEARLTMELEARAFTEGQQKSDSLTRAEADLRERLQGIEVRLGEDGNAALQARSALLSPEQRQAFEQARDDTNAQLEQARIAEDNARRIQDEANTAWLEARAKAEEGIQRHRALTRAQEQATQALEQARRRLDTLTTEEDRTRKALLPEEQRTEAHGQVADLEARLTALQETIRRSETAVTVATEQDNAARQALTTLETDILRATGEAEGLAETLAAVAAQPDPVDAALEIPPDLVRAVATALADGLDASLAPERIAADRRWYTLPAMEGSPFAGYPSLASLLDYPDALSRCLSAVFLLDDPAKGPALQKNLCSGQALVCRNGAFWRWDGFVRAANAPDAGIARLEQRQRLNDIRARLATFEARRPELEQASQTADRARKVAICALDDCRKERSALEPALAEARTVASRLAQQDSLTRTQWEQARTQLEEAREGYASQTQNQQQAQADLTAHPSPNVLTETAERCAAAAEKARQDLAGATRTAQTARDMQEQTLRQLDQAVLRHDTARNRLTDLEAGLNRLTQEKNALHAQLEDLLQTTDRPDLPHLTERARTAWEAYETWQQQARHHATEATKSQQIAERHTQELHALDQSATTLLAHQKALLPRAAELQQLVATLERQRHQQQQDIASRPDPALLERKTLSASGNLARTREALRTSQEERSRISLEDVRITGALTALRSRLTDLESRLQTLSQTQADLTTREAHLREAHASASAIPPQLEDAFSRQEHELAAAQTSYDAARARDEATDQAGQDAQERRRTAEQALSSAREAIARLTERAEQAQASRERLLAESAPPVGGAYPSDLSEQAETSTRRRLSRLTREREDLGAVNLRAELEFEEARETAETIAREHAELTAAINRLRGGIGTINKEGRERLLAVFTEVDRHFQSLFTRMFGGGKAHLGMVGSDDPLEAGLEIFAQPPGKKLSTLSLLSGGEQALTALSLIFATFRCNPAPICVLDEVDAPLDDANVERFCSLLADMTKEAGTRFLVVTHHQLTMAHMDRLYGVTMQERGVSRVLSVDLGHAAALVEG
ncbi:AAA family ATPase [Gluconobacter morbifer]|uniref:Chromosome partition protein Smc n=1 Tax=Gluconobacter morbifer G707 TaxID=1088869 RepID=G6XGU5_9PROT|nr:AAA family ATPase [Gluconobacter morbifer]EHH69403.1 chromosome partition protein Smc [Gluconobacter morbifer G707]